MRSFFASTPVRIGALVAGLTAVFLAGAAPIWAPV